MRTLNCKTGSMLEATAAISYKGLGWLDRAAWVERVPTRSPAVRRSTNPSAFALYLSKRCGTPARKIWRPGGRFERPIYRQVSGNLAPGPTNGICSQRSRLVPAAQLADKGADGPQQSLPRNVGWLTLLRDFASPASLRPSCSRAFNIPLALPQWFPSGESCPVRDCVSGMPGLGHNSPGVDRATRQKLMRCPTLETKAHS
jgi:hypothetical protein